MSNLFRKAAVCTDIHFGLKSNSTQHNEDCLNFIKWFTAKAKEEGCETCIFTGDWHNNRASINIVTLNYSLKALEHLNNNFDHVFFIPGNHDLYYRDKRDVQSVEWARHLPNVHIMNDWLQEGDVIFAPWMVGEDYKRVPKYSGKYMFGHFELPNFFMNAMVQMPDHGEIKAEAFGGIETVFTGHFHKRQVQRNIHYIGNCFPHNYADAADDQRGMMVLDWGRDPEYFSWPDQPRYRVYQLSDLLQHTEARLQPGMHVRVDLDVDISYEEATFIKEEFVGKYKLREITLIPQKHISEDISFDTQGNIKFESVDTIVTNQLTNINSEQYSPNMLLDIYRNL